MFSKLNTNANAVSKKSGWSSGYMTEVVKNRKEPGSGKLFSLKKAIFAEFGKNLNLDWLITGEGEMLTKSESELVDEGLKFFGDNSKFATKDDVEEMRSEIMEEISKLQNK